MALLGLDIGTTGTKSTVFDSNGKILAYAYMEYNLISDGKGHYEIKPNEIWQAVKVVIRESVKQSGHVKIDAMCTSSFGEAFVLLDEKDNPLNNIAIYMDKRGVQEVQELKEKIGTERLMQITGHPLQPMYSISKLLWYKNNRKDIYEKTEVIHFIGDYLLFKLSGVHTADYSLAARSMCFDITKKQWSNEIIDAVGIKNSIFPQVQSMGSIVGEILTDVADEIGINTGVKMVLGAHDQIMVAVGAGITRQGQSVNGIGTVDCITPVFESFRVDRDMMKCGYASVPYLFDNTFVTYAFNMTGGSLLKWFRDCFANQEAKIAKEDGISIYDQLAEEMPAEPTNLFVLPHFVGAPIPNSDVDAKGAILNLTLGTKRGEIYKACMEGEAFEMRLNIESLERNGIMINQLVTVGGGAKSKKWLQIRADIFGKEIIALDFEEAGTIGCAVLAGIASGCFNSIEDAVTKMAGQKYRYYPNEKHTSYYNNQYKKYLHLYDAIKKFR